MRKLILSFASIAVITFLLFACSKKDDDSNTPVATCSDGIQNQGETGVDCGGPCAPCHTVLCDGNGSGSFFPLTLNNKWVYDFTYANTYTTCDTVNVSGTSVYGGKTYYQCSLYDTQSGWTINYYFRLDATTQNIYTWNGSSDVLYLPANPTVGQLLGSSTELFTGIGYSRKVESTTATVTTPRCTYTNCLKIQVYNSSNGQVMAHSYYKKGIGPVLGAGSQQLKSITLH